MINHAFTLMRLYVDAKIEGRDFQVCKRGEFFDRDYIELPCVAIAALAALIITPTVLYWRFQFDLKKEGAVIIRVPEHWEVRHLNRQPEKEPTRAQP